MSASMSESMSAGTSISPVGKVFIVGAGPGDPELLTIKALRVIESADVVLYDRLVSEGVRALIPASADKVYVGKGHGEQDAVQTEIMELLAHYARQNQQVVRLKGGDPFVFGRGAEEWAYLLRQKIVVEVVPGISSSLAVPGLAGIPLTYRHLARGFAVVTGHRSVQSQPAHWPDYVRVETLVVLMGVGERGEIARELIAAGRDPQEPIAFIERGTTSRERVVTGVLADAATLAVEAPAVWVIGPVVGVRRELV
jgi:uroporphyrin-III C-methyltransferase